MEAPIPIKGTGLPVLLSCSDIFLLRQMTFSIAAFSHLLFFIYFIKSPSVQFREGIALDIILSEV